AGSRSLPRALGPSLDMAASAGPAAPRTKTKRKRFVPQRVKVPRAADPLL
uniref:Uncharacterized protein n=1 Tax=Chrysemys picta bellii TaxID=8478 RepID=A0A8C3H5L3_CHRPI